MIDTEINERYAEKDIRTSLTIPEKIYKDIKINHWTLKDLLISGYFARKSEPVWKDRIRELEEKLMKITQKLQDYTQKSWEMEEKLRKLGGFQ